MKKKKFWRTCPFNEDETFEVKENITQHESSFYLGERVVFIRTEGSYGKVTRYLFKDSKGKLKTFEMTDNKGIEELERLFVKTESPLPIKHKKKITLFEILVIVAIVGVILRLVIMVPILKESLFNYPILSVVGVIAAILFLKFKRKNFR